MATRNSTAAPRANRTTKSAPRLAAVTPDVAPRRIGFAADGFSLLGSIPALVASLPMVRYDPRIGGNHLVGTRDEKEDELERLGNAAFSVHRTIKLIGKLMASQDDAAFPLDADDISELGFALHGLAHIAQELVQASEQLSEASVSDERVEATHE